MRDWVVRFNEGGPDALVARKAPGKPPLLSPEQRAALAQVIEDGPVPAVDGVVRWRLVDLVQWVWAKFAISISRQTLGRELRAVGCRKLSARPRHHAQAAVRWTLLKSLSGDHSGGRPHPRPQSQQGRRRGRRTEKQDHPAMGVVRHASQRAARSAHRINLHFRRDLPGRGEGRGLGPAVPHAAPSASTSNQTRRAPYVRSLPTKLALTCAPRTSSLSARALGERVSQA